MTWLDPSCDCASSSRAAGSLCNADAVRWARGIPDSLFFAWSLTVWARANLLPLTLVALLTPLTGQALAAELVAYVVVRILRGNCTLSGFASDELMLLRRTLNTIRPFLPADMYPAADAISAALAGRVDVAKLCKAVNASKRFSDRTRGLPTLPCPSSSTSSSSSSSSSPGMTSVDVARKILDGSRFVGGDVQKPASSTSTRPANSDGGGAGALLGLGALGFALKILLLK